jgi:plasmid stability protein
MSSTGRATRRATVYLDPDVHRALRLKAAAADRSISDLVNAALKQALAEDAEDLEAFEKRRAEKGIDFERFVRDLKRRGRL